MPCWLFFGAVGCHGCVGPGGWGDEPPHLLAAGRTCSLLAAPARCWPRLLAAGRACSLLVARCFCCRPHVLRVPAARAQGAGRACSGCWPRVFRVLAARVPGAGCACSGCWLRVF